QFGGVALGGCSLVANGFFQLGHADPPKVWAIARCAGNLAALSRAFTPATTRVAQHERDASAGFSPGCATPVGPSLANDVFDIVERAPQLRGRFGLPWRLAQAHGDRSV